MSWDPSALKAGGRAVLSRGQNEKDANLAQLKLLFYSCNCCISTVMYGLHFLRQLNTFLAMAGGANADRHVL
jgi:hypothetical protein